MELNRHNNPYSESSEEDLSEAVEENRPLEILSEIIPSESGVSVEIEESSEELDRSEEEEEEENRPSEILSEIIFSESGASVKIEEENVRHHEESSSSSSSDPCIFRTPFPELQFQRPQLASIGPYHRGKNLPLEKYKYSFLEKFVSRTKNYGKDLCFYVRNVMTLEWRTRRCYADDFQISSPEFVEMMLVDGCFIMEVLRHFGRIEPGQKPKKIESEDGYFPIQPWQIPILVQDLLMLENQIPFFVLQKLFDLSENEEGTTTVSVPTMALKFFDLPFPLSMDFICNSNHLEANHLLELFLESIRPSNPSTILNSFKLKVVPKSVYSFLGKISTINQSGVSKRAEDQEKPQGPQPTINLKQKEYPSYRPSEPSISKRAQLAHEQRHPYFTKGAKELQTLDITFRPRRADRFTDINFKDGVLAIPPVTINDLFITILINCVAFEMCSKSRSKDLTAYVCFMISLIRHPTDVELLCSNGIISRFSYNENKVAETFNISCPSTLPCFAIPDSYLSKSVMEIQRHCTEDGNGTTWLWRHHFMIYSAIILFCITDFFFDFNSLKWVLLIIRMILSAQSVFSKLHHTLFLNLIILVVFVASEPVDDFPDLVDSVLAIFASIEEGYSSPYSEEEMIVETRRREGKAKATEEYDEISEIYFLKREMSELRKQLSAIELKMKQLEEETTKKIAAIQDDANMTVDKFQTMTQQRTIM
ncbi:hypothetical protein PTKIN_Ptkin14bG0076400 [Pterospermum kingtungense]